MATLDDLLNSSMGGTLLTPEQRQARIDAIVANAMPANLRQYGETAQQQNEAAFGKGMGLSTWNAYKQALNSLAQTEGAGNIRNAAQQEVDAAQNAAIGNAASYATAEKNRATSAALANQQNSTVRRGQNAYRSMNTQNQIYSGLGGLATGAGGILSREFKPEISGALRSGYEKLFGGNAPTPATEAAPNVGPADVGTAGDMGAANAGFQAPPSMEIPSFDLSTPSYATPSLSDVGYMGSAPTFMDPSQWNFNLQDLLNSDGGM